MTAIWIIMLTSLAAAIRSAAYGIYTWQEENKCGSVGLFVICAACLCVTGMSAVSILTNW